MTIGRPSRIVVRLSVEIGYLDAAAPKKLLPRLNQLANRLKLTAEEVHILRGIARAATLHRTRDKPGG